MKKLIVIVAASAFIVGCSSTKPARVLQSETTQELSEKGKKASVSFEESYGRVTVEFDEDGNWLRIKSVGTASMSGSTEASYTLASMRAKRAISEFLSNGIRSQKTFDGIYRATGELDLDDSNRDKLSKTLRDRISDSSSTILRGAFVSKRTMNGDDAVVEITASRKSIATSNEIRKLMGGL